MLDSVVCVDGQPLSRRVLFECLVTVLRWLERNFVVKEHDELAAQECLELFLSLAIWSFVGLAACWKGFKLEVKELRLW